MDQRSPILYIVQSTERISDDDVSRLASHAVSLGRPTAVIYVWDVNKPHHTVEWLHRQEARAAVSGVAFIILVGGFADVMAGALFHLKPHVSYLCSSNVWLHSYSTTQGITCELGLPASSRSPGDELPPGWPGVILSVTQLERAGLI